MASGTDVSNNEEKKDDISDAADAESLISDDEDELDRSVDDDQREGEQRHRLDRPAHCI